VTGPISIEARSVCKSFDLGRGNVVGVRDRMRMVRAERPQYHVLRNVSFDVRSGEAMGCVGPNGVGKSTLLKLIAGIYGIDSGSIRVAGKVAPLIELGVGFRPDLPARENIHLNGVMMGLTPAEARRRTDEIIDFAELREHTRLKLKNYSSGMRGRLGFSVMIHVDADVLLIDEILSVGDQSFRRKAGDVIANMRKKGRTIVLVSHEMGSISRHCERAMLLMDGTIQLLGDAEYVANRYHEMHAIQQVQASGGDAAAPPASVLSMRLVDSPGAHLRPRQALTVEAEVEMHDRMERPGIRFIVHDGAGRPIFVAPAKAIDAPHARPGRRFVARATIENRLAPGPYILSSRISEQVGGFEGQSSPAKWLRFTIEGEEEMGTIVSLETEVAIEDAFGPEPATPPLETSR
jgi:ABC-type polysaccharide/polyol phosphate transport system ATPase subunit